MTQEAGGDKFKLASLPEFLQIYGFEPYSERVCLSLLFQPNIVIENGNVRYDSPNHSPYCNSVEDCWSDPQLLTFPLKVNILKWGSNYDQNIFNPLIEEYINLSKDTANYTELKPIMYELRKKMSIFLLNGIEFVGLYDVQMKAEGNPTGIVRIVNGQPVETPKYISGFDHMVVSPVFYEMRENIPVFGNLVDKSIAWKKNLYVILNRPLKKIY